MKTAIACALVLFTLTGCDAQLAPGGPLADVWPQVLETADSLVARGEWSSALQQVTAARGVVLSPFAPSWQRRQWAVALDGLERAMVRSGAHRDSLAYAMQQLRAARLASQHDSMSAAEARAEHAYTVRLAALGASHPSTAIASLGLADVEFRLSRIGRADSLAMQAVPVLKAAYGMHPDVALAHEQLGRDLKNFSGGAARVRALEAYRTALQIRVRTLGPDSPMASITHHEIGNLERLTGHHASALGSFRLSLGARRRSRGPVHDEVASTLSAMTILEAMQGHWRSADSLANAMMAATPSEGTPPMSRAFRAGVFGQVARHNGHLEASTRALEEAVALNEAAWVLSPRDEGTVVQSGMSLHAELALAYIQAGRPLDALVVLERGTSRPLRERLAHPEPEATAAWFTELQRCVRPDEALVAWVRSRFGVLGADDPAWAVVVRSTGAPHWVRLPGSTRPGPRALAYYWNELGTGASWPVRVPDEPRLRDMAKAAGAVWFAPIESLLLGVHSIVVCSPDLCAGGPPAGLVDSNGRWLGERFVFSHSPSMALHARSRARSRAWPRAGGVIAVGDPAYPTEGADPWARLAGSADELASVQAAFPHVQVLRGSGATAVALRRLARDGSLSKARLLHLTGHTAIDVIRPLESALVLAPDQMGDRDSRLTTREIAEQWRLDADLVCLTGCRGAIGQSSAMQGSIGFQYALLRAGARSVLVSLWPVDDAAAARLVSEFYLRLGTRTEQTTRAVALAQAQRAVREWQDATGRRPFAHPAYWAGFALIGDPD